MSKKVINLSTGLEFVQLGFVNKVDAYVRFQSTLLEQKKWQKFLDNVDNTFLYWLATGERIDFYDCGSRRHDGKSRVIWQGIPFIQFMCRKAWDIPSPNKVFVKEHNVKDYFEEVARSINYDRLKYFHDKCTVESFQLYCHYFPSIFDGSNKPFLGRIFEYSKVRKPGCQGLGYFVSGLQREPGIFYDYVKPVQTAYVIKELPFDVIETTEGFYLLDRSEHIAC